jgi:thiol-disulfide isomerase/thioredoxin
MRQSRRLLRRGTKIKHKKTPSHGNFFLVPVTSLPSFPAKHLFTTTNTKSHPTMKKSKLAVLLGVAAVAASFTFVNAMYLGGKSPAKSSAPKTPQKVLSPNEILNLVAKDAVLHKGDAAPKLEAIKKKKYLFLYFSASWCPPCQRFTPKLVKFYNQNIGNGDFDLIFVSCDENPKAMEAYMEKDKMPWVGVKPESPSANSLSKSFKVRGIPYLVLLNEKGEILKDGHGDEALRAYEKLTPKKQTPPPPANENKENNN